MKKKGWPKKPATGLEQGFLSSQKAGSAVPVQISKSPLGHLAQTAKTHAIAGAAAGVAVGVIDGIISVRQSRVRDRYDVVTEGLTHIGTGAILGVMAASVTALAGVSITAIAGRGILAIAVPMVASTVVTESAHKRVASLVRSWSEDVVTGLKQSLQPPPTPDAT